SPIENSVPFRPFEFPLLCFGCGSHETLSRGSLRAREIDFILTGLYRARRDEFTQLLKGRFFFCLGLFPDSAYNVVLRDETISERLGQLLYGVARNVWVG